MALTAYIDQFNQSFATEQQCLSFIYEWKWPNGFCCPRCSHSAAYTITTRNQPLFECRKCKHQTTLTANTVFNKSRTALRKWLLVLYLVSTSKEGIHAVQLAQLIQVTYKTAWSMLNKVRAAISEYDERTLLNGFVEAKLEVYMKQLHPTYVGENKEHAAIAASGTLPNQSSSYFKIKLAKEKGIARNRLSSSMEDAFIKDHVHPELEQLTINRWYVNVPNSTATLPQLAQSAFKWMNDHFHGLSLKYAQSYLDEYCYRRNISYDQSCAPLVHLLSLCLSKKGADTDKPNWTDSELSAVNKRYLERQRIDWFSMFNPASAIDQVI